MIVVGLLVVGAFVVLACGNALDDEPHASANASEPRSAGILDALLFLLCLAGILLERHRRAQDEDG